MDDALLKYPLFIRMQADDEERYTIFKTYDAFYTILENLQKKQISEYDESMLVSLGIDASILKQVFTDLLPKNANKACLKFYYSFLPQIKWYRDIAYNFWQLFRYDADIIMAPATYVYDYLLTTLDSFLGNLSIEDDIPFLYAINNENFFQIIRSIPKKQQQIAIEDLISIMPWIPKFELEDSINTETPEHFNACLRRNTPTAEQSGKFNLFLKMLGTFYFLHSYLNDNIDKNNARLKDLDYKVKDSINAFSMLIKCNDNDKEQHINEEIKQLENIYNSLEFALLQLTKANFSVYENDDDTPKSFLIVCDQIKKAISKSLEENPEYHQIYDKALAEYKAELKQEADAEQQKQIEVKDTKPLPQPNNKSWEETFIDSRMPELSWEKLGVDKKNGYKFIYQLRDGLINEGFIVDEERKDGLEKFHEWYYIFNINALPKTFDYSMIRPILWISEKQALQYLIKQLYDRCPWLKVEKVFWDARSIPTPFKDMGNTSGINLDAEWKPMIDRIIQEAKAVANQ